MFGEVVWFESTTTYSPNWVLSRVIFWAPSDFLEILLISHTHIHTHTHTPHTHTHTHTTYAYMHTCTHRCFSRNNYWVVFSYDNYINRTYLHVISCTQRNWWRGDHHSNGCYFFGRTSSIRRYISGRRTDEH